MGWKNKFIVSFIVLILSVCVFLGVLILQPFNNQSTVLIVGAVCILLFFFATYFSTIYFRRWQGYYSKNNKFSISVETEKELMNAIIKNLSTFGYDKSLETVQYDLYELAYKKQYTIF